MRLRSRDLFQTVHTEGGLLPSDLLQRIADNDPTLDGLKPTDYHLDPGERLNEAVTRAWTRLQAAWSSFDEARSQLAPEDRGGRITRERWLHILFDALGYGRLVQQPAIEIEGRSYPVFGQWQHTPIHLVGCGVKIDTRTPGVQGAAGQSPHSLVQELLNRSAERLWGIVSNGLVLRLLRDNIALTRQAYVEFDLEAMFTGEVYPDFVLLWLVCHQSRVEAERAEECWLERWTRTAADQGARALDVLRDGVQEAIEKLGVGFLAHPANHGLRDSLHDGTLDARGYYRALLRLVYRLLFLFVAEDRDALLDPLGDPLARSRYLDHYSTRRLRELATQRRGGRQHDRYEQLKLVMAALHELGCPPLALPALGSYLWSPEAIGPLAEAKIANDDLLSAIRSLATVEVGGVRRSVDFRNLGAEELGSVYESLLELHPTLDRPTATFTLDQVAGSERKTTGSYYTPSSLISSLLDTALDPVIDEAVHAEDPEAAILSLAVVDPACGSGHFLIAAANRIAKRLAAIRSDDPEPAPTEVRAALRDVVGSCIHGVDMNPMAVELCKVSLWMEALEPGRPLSFLDHRIALGNSLLGTTPELISAGIPSDAFKPILGDDRKTVAELRKHNAKQLQGQLAFDMAAATADADARALAQQAAALAAIDDHSLAGVREQQRRFELMLESPELCRAGVAADVWCAAFVADKRPGATPMTQDVLIRVLSKGEDGLSRDELATVREAREAYSFLHWHIAFPDVWDRGGFDVVVGNPPWEHTELKEKEFFAGRAPDIAGAPTKAARERLIAALEDEDQALFVEFQAARRRADGWSHLLRSTGRYPLCGRGRTNTYAVFAELMRTLVGPGGRAGIVVPTGIATDDTTKLFFRDIVERRSLVSLFGFENEAFVFPAVHHDTKFCLLTMAARPVAADPEFVFFARQVADLADDWRRFTLSASDITLLNPNTGTCPTFRSSRDAAVTKRIYAKNPPFVHEGLDDGNPWGARFAQGLFNMSTDSALFEEFEGDDRLPLYEGKMLWQFNHRFGTYAGQTQAQANQGTLPSVSEVEHRDPGYTPTPRYWVARSAVDAAARSKALPSWLISFRDITNVVNERSMVFAAAPYSAFGHTAPLVILDSVGVPERLACIALLNSFAADYVCRQKLAGKHLTFFILKQVAIPAPAQLGHSCAWDSSITYCQFLAARTLELIYTSHDLAAVGEDLADGHAPFVWDSERRMLIRAELDAAVFNIYGLERDDVVHIMSTFPVAEAYENRDFGEFRSQRLILERYDAMKAAQTSASTYVTFLDPPPSDVRATYQQATRRAVQASEIRAVAR